jgi:hypothetical protein
MSEASDSDDDLRDEYDFTVDQLRAGVRGKFAGRGAREVQMVPIDPDLADVFPDARSVNQALRALASVIRDRIKDEAA